MNRKTAAALLITIVLLFFIFYKIDVSILIETFKTFKCNNLLVITFLYLFSLLLRGVRWKFILNNDARYSIVKLAEIFTVGSLMNVFIPARAGDLYRAYYLGEIKNEKKMKILGSVILERIFDGIAVFVMLLIAVINYCRQDWIVRLSGFVGLLFIGSLIVAYILIKSDRITPFFSDVSRLSSKLPAAVSKRVDNILNLLKGYILSMIEGLDVLNNVFMTFSALIVSGIIWGIEFVIAILILKYGFSLQISLSVGLFIIALTSFSTMIPSTSVFLGPYQYAYILALGIYGVSKSAALAIATVHQGLLTLILLVVGGVIIIKNNLKRVFYRKTDLISDD